MTTAKPENKGNSNFDPTLSLHSSLNVRDHVSQPYSTTGNITVLNWNRVERAAYCILCLLRTLSQLGPTNYLLLILAWELASSAIYLTSLLSGPLNWGAILVQGWPNMPFHSIPTYPLSFYRMLMEDTYVQLINCRLHLFRSSASSFSSQYLLLFLK